ncbi:LON peptidase substrate-binding domain-containing protein [Nocardioides campestrisoli]|uniref:LON peptidase substrate-binding domain-containing protein n=1 Tax=Nocardioides campestrisoli TaxID=2736757 RepID=UPI00281213E7|nr:LON peptidase substrate-binding domain-containing protein [Nocardioides campestrisoli]
MTQPPPGVLPMFPLSTVLFPGVSIPLHVFEERYRALVQHLAAEPDPARRLFGSVAIREGYEVGDHGAQSLYRVGCVLQLSEIEPLDDGGYDIVAVGRGRFRLDRLRTDGDFPQAEVTDLGDGEVEVPAELVARSRATFTAYRAAVSQFRADPFDGALPRDPQYLSWTLAALVPLPMAERQELLEAPNTRERLELVTGMLREELRAMNVIPSLPATEVARTRWSPN